VQGAVSISDADCGWLLVRDGQRKAFILGAQRHLPDDIAARVVKPGRMASARWSPSPANPLSIHGEPIKRFKISRLGLSALVMPVKARSEVVGLLAVLRKEALPFSPNIQTLLGAVTDYAPSRSSTRTCSRLCRSVPCTCSRWQMPPRRASAVRINC